MLKETIFQMRTINEGIPPQLDLRFHLCGTTYPNKNYAINRPDSNVACLEFIIAGTGQVHAGEVTFAPRAGDTYFLPAGISHHYASDRREPWEKIWINLSGSYLEELSARFGIAGLYHFPMLDTSDLLQKFQYYAQRPDRLDTAEKCVGLITQLFFRMSVAGHASAQHTRTPVQLMLDYIAQHETDSIRLEQLALVSGKSPSQAERLFRAATGTPPYRYVLNRKIELACQLLTETGMPIRDIASYLSFDDEFYFSGLFRQKKGLSPTQYRKNASKK